MGSGVVQEFPTKLGEAPKYAEYEIRGDKPLLMTIKAILSRSNFEVLTVNS